MTKERMLALFRWETPVEMSSVMSVPEVLARLRSITGDAYSWRRLNRLTSDAPLVGQLSEHGGEVVLRAFYPSIAVGRELSFRFEQALGGTRLVGVLRLRTSLLMYQVCGWIAMFALQGWMIYLWLKGGYPWSWRGAGQILQEFGLIPFIWGYIWLGLWWTKKKEARMLALVQAALVPLPPTPIPPARVAEISTPTEVFIRPRHESPD